MEFSIENDIGLPRSFGIMHSGPNHGTQEFAVNGLLTNPEPSTTFILKQEHLLKINNLSNKMSTWIAFGNSTINGNDKTLFLLSESDQFTWNAV